jgi:hypothetical protein
MRPVTPVRFECFASTGVNAVGTMLPSLCYPAIGDSNDRAPRSMRFLEGHPHSANNLDKSRITPEGVESGIHPDIRHSKASLSDAFPEPGESIVGFSQSCIHGGHVVAADKAFPGGSQELLQ